MLVFKGRLRRDPAHRAEPTNSEKRIMRMLSRARQSVIDDVKSREGEFLNALMHQSAQKVARLVVTEPWIALSEELRDEFLAEIANAGRRVQLPSIQKATINFRFDAERPEAARWAAKNAGELIQGATQDQLLFVQELVSQAELGGYTPAQAARTLREMENGLGLTTQQSEWVANFESRRITDLMDQGFGYEASVARAQTPTARYADRIYRYRTETIARTEILRASNEGRNQAWQQGIDEGFINPNQEKEWSVNIDDRTCDICAPLDGERVLVGEDFAWGDPPRHPNCRCTVLLTDDIPKDLLDMTEDELESEIDGLISGEHDGLLTPERPLGGSVPDDAVNELVDYEWEEDVDEWLENVGVDPGPNRTMDPDAHRAWDDYAGDGYVQMNGRLRSGDIGNDVTAQTIRDLAGYINEAPPIRDNIRVYRGMTGVKDMSFEPGSTFVHQGFMSTSPIQDEASKFAQGTDGVLFRMTAVAGTRATVGGGAGEAEIIFAPGSKVRIVGAEASVVNGNEMTIVHAEIQP